MGVAPILSTMVQIVTPPGTPREPSINSNSGSVKSISSNSTGSVDVSIETICQSLFQQSSCWLRFYCKQSSSFFIVSIHGYTTAFFVVGQDCNCNHLTWSKSLAVIIGLQINNRGVLGSKPLANSKIVSVFDPSELLGTQWLKVNCLHVVALRP